MKKLTKQDRQGVRTPADLERKYNFGKVISDIGNITKNIEVILKEIIDIKKSLDFLLENNGSDNPAPPEIVNHIPYPFNESTKTENGITFTDNGDGTITVNGTATANATFTVATGLILPASKYKLSGCPVGGNRGTRYFLEGNVTGQSSITDIGEGSIKDYSSAETDIMFAKIYFRIVSGQTVENLVFAPCLETVE